jgi:hypothetical protein
MTVENLKLRQWIEAARWRARDMFAIGVENAAVAGTHEFLSVGVPVDGASKM